MSAGALMERLRRTRDVHLAPTADVRGAARTVPGCQVNIRRHLVASEAAFMSPAPASQVRERRYVWWIAPEDCRRPRRPPLR